MSIQEYHHVDQILHQLAQTITKFNRSYVQKKADDSHTNLAFDSSNKRLLGRWVSAQDSKIIMGLDLGSYTFEIFDEAWQVLKRFSIIGKTQSEIEKDMKVFLPKLGLDSQGFTDSLHFQITQYPFAESAFETPIPQEIICWETIRTRANHTCVWVLDCLKSKGEVRIWPHHFDTGIYMELNDTLAIGFGLAMKDTLMGYPYYYCSAYDLKGKIIDYTKFSELDHGQWKIEATWKGAVIDGFETEEPDVHSFVKQVTGQYMNLI